MHNQAHNQARSFVNRRAKFNYHIEDSLEVGLVLMGSEVKAIRNGRVSLQESYVAERENEFWLFNATIGAYQPAVNFHCHADKRIRKILVSRRQGKKLLGLVKRDRYSLVPLRLYFNRRGYAKLDLAIAKGKEKVDKRETIKQREWERRKNRLLP